MAYKIVWSEKSVNDLKGISKYFLKNWGESSEQKFKKKLSNRIKLISHYPQLHRVSELKPKYRMAVLNKQISIVYSFESQQVQNIRLFDNRSNPENL